MFIQEIEKEVDHLCDERYRHTQNENHPWGSQRGSVVLDNQHLAIEKDRIRNAMTGKEVKLKTYEQFQDPSLFEQQIFAEVLKKVS